MQQLNMSGNRKLLITSILKGTTKGNTYMFQTIMINEEKIIKNINKFVKFQTASSTSRAEMKMFIINLKLITRRGS